LKKRARWLKGEKNKGKVYDKLTPKTGWLRQRRKRGRKEEKEEP